MKRNSRYIISGGGTGGHIFPAISIADELKRQEPDCEILFVGAEGRMEMEKVPAAGYTIKGIPVSGLKRSLSPENLKLPFKILKSLKLAKNIIRDFKPDAVIGVGGYASAPTLWQAQRMGIPTVIQEQNSYAGLTNRIVGKKAMAVCVAYENMERFFPADRIVMTGNPVRKGIRRYSLQDRENAVRELGLDPEKKTLFIVGGSLGSGTLNRSVMEWARTSYDDRFNIIWQCGKYYASECIPFAGKGNYPTLHVFDFIKNMDTVYAAADLVISRAGAGTISELAIAGKAVIFVPSPNVTENHQFHNAMAMVKRNAAEITEDAEAPEKLMKKAAEMIADTELLEKLSTNIVKYAITDSAERIVAQIEKYKRKD